MGKHGKNNKKALAIIVLILLATFFLVTPLGHQLLSTGFLTGTQGLQAEFQSVNYDNAYWSNTEQPEGANPSVKNFGYSMAFDPDGSQNFKPDLCCSQQPITVDSDVQPKSYIWNYKVESDKVLDNGTIVDVYKQFEMYRYKCDWSLDLWLSGTEAEALGRERVVFGDQEQNPNYAGSTIWIKLTPRNFVYFIDNPDQVFFAPCYIGLSEETTWVGIDQDGKQILDDADIKKTEDIIPKVEGETVGIYYQRGGGDVVTEDTYLEYEGTQLDPEIFRSEYWMRISLLNFKPVNSWDVLLRHSWKFPSGQLKFLVYVFVVGEWTVQIKTGEVPGLTPHTPIGGGGGGLFDWVLNWLSNPFNQIWVLLIIAVVVIVIVSVTSPGVWMVLAQTRRKGG